MFKLPLVFAPALAGLVMVSHAGSAEEQSPPPKVTCPVDTMTDNGGVKICHDDKGSAGVTIPVDPNVLKYPIGRSDKSVAKQVGNAVHHFFSHL
ncbi:hypothetical protein [Mesorhizobium sp. CA16]|uniref:hypothetical protein n=1 Tax=Mesorhizobium sp. CA16 TaxID=588496 RepID=UPI001CCF234B|nr:hypothetical protein [Mesorhizobium sp. CA16]MBZ9910999.1 hypothetical protein [Mesorhizobium sp. CA16]